MHTDAVKALKNGSSETLVYIVDDAQVPIGVLTIGWKAPYLQLVFIDEPYRRSQRTSTCSSILPSSRLLVDMQVKANGRLGRPDSQVDKLIRDGVTKAIEQLPVPPTRPALVVMCAQRWPLSGDTHVLETMIGSSLGYPDGRVLLPDDAVGELAKATHVSGIVMLDYRRSLTFFDYDCSVLMNPWATHRLDPAWFPHSRVLSCTDDVFTWVRGDPDATYFPT